MTDVTITVGAVLRSHVLTPCIGKESAKCGLMCRSLVTCRVFMLDGCTCILYEKGPNPLYGRGAVYIGTGLGLVEMSLQ